MAITVEDISSTKKRLGIEIPADIIEKEYGDSLNRIRQRVRIPGFRPGHAPVIMIEKRFSSEIRSELIEKLVPSYYANALKEANLVPVSTPTIESSLEIRKNEPLAFSLTVEVRPRIESLNYTGLRLDNLPVEVEDAEVDETLKGIQEEKAIFDAVDREVQAGDLLIIDSVKLDPTGERELSSAKDQALNLGNNLTPPGIIEQLVGRRKGDVVEVSLPAFEDENVQTGAEKGVRIRITIKEVKEKKLSDIDTEFAKDFGHETLESFRKAVREKLEKAKQDGAARQQKQKLLDILVESHDFDVPQSLLEAEVEKLTVNEKLSRKRSAPPLPEGAGGRADEPELDPATVEALRQRAVRNVKIALLLDLIADREGVTVSEEDLRSRIALLARNFQTTPEAVINLFVTKDGSLDALRETVRNEKVLDVVLAKSEVVKGAAA